ncbi:DUF1534 domain-containing protein [Pseudomonas syringae pv. tomato]|nr:DUF1534 domain-containing protein [Pseudomonas syringae]TES69928.1 DUF1534 domain-containing protein [Pseudomonas syringae pv. tomato]
MLQTRHLSFSRSSAFKIGRGASRNACDAERRTIVILRRCTATERFKIGRGASRTSLPRRAW